MRNTEFVHSSKTFEFLAFVFDVMFCVSSLESPSIYDSRLLSDSCLKLVSVVVSLQSAKVVAKFRLFE